MPRIKISPLTLIWLITLIYFKPPYVPQMIIAVAMHEAGHLACAKALGIRVKSMTLSMLGARIRCESIPSYGKEFLLAAAGPLAGIALFVICYLFNKFHVSEFLLSTGAVSLALAIFNLLPLPSFDGGRMIFCAACSIFSLDKALKISNTLGFISILLLWLLSVYLMLKIASGMAMFVFCSFFFLKRFIFSVKNREFERF